jgi:hypothetical protein
MPENIRLDYPVYVILHDPSGDHEFHAKSGAEFFQDEHGNQWVKFFPMNGYHSGLEHMFRTEHVTIVRRKGEVPILDNDEAIHRLFNELHAKLTRASVREEFGDVSSIASSVDAAHHDFTNLVLDASID